MMFCHGCSIASPKTGATSSILAAGSLKVITNNTLLKNDRTKFYIISIYLFSLPTIKIPSIHNTKEGGSKANSDI